MPPAVTEVNYERTRRMWRDSKGRLRRIVLCDGEEGYIERRTIGCLGCTEYGDYGVSYGAAGCEDCGFTGRRRIAEWFPFAWTPEATAAASRSDAVATPL